MTIESRDTARELSDAEAEDWWLSRAYLNANQEHLMVHSRDGTRTTNECEALNRQSIRIMYQKLKKHMLKRLVQEEVRSKGPEAEKLILETAAGLAGQLRQELALTHEFLNAEQIDIAAFRAELREAIGQIASGQQKKPGA